MQWSDEAIVLSVRRLGESSAIIHLLTRAHGMYAGVDKGAFSKRKRGMYQAGNEVAAHWQARLPEHLGMLSCEPVKSSAAQLLLDRRKLAALTSATLMTEKILTEREPHPEVHDCLQALLASLCDGDDWLTDYVRLEYTLLVTAGFGLDLDRCAATGQEHDLIYVSPKSGRAVSREAGAPYHEKLFKLPPFLRAEENSISVDLTHILDGLRLCGFFLETRVFTPRGIPVPAVRSRFLHVLQPPIPAANADSAQATA